jgi:hypothetical protein
MKIVAQTGRGLQVKPAMTVQGGGVRILEKLGRKYKENHIFNFV